MNRLRWAAAGALALAIGVAAPAAAGREHDVNWIRMDGSTTISTGSGTFTAFAIDGGICSSGTTTDEAAVSTAADFLRFDVRKTFTCDDGSGTFVVKLVAKVHPCDRFDYGSWQIVEGTGNYEKLRGGGQLVGLYERTACDSDRVDDSFRGSIRNRTSD